jgi:hypothetical protein
MKRIFILLLIGLSMSYICSYGQKISGKAMIKVPEIETSNHTTNSLQRFISDPENEGASVVVRDPNINKDGVSTNPINTRVCALIERGLMEKKLNPRDRRLFENAVAKLEDGSDFPTIHKVTGTDLIFEITQFNAVEFSVSEYYDSDNPSRKYSFLIKKDKKNILKPTYTLIGFSIEIKVILLADNLIAGIYKYNKIPCTDGCEITLIGENNLRYINSETRKTVVAKETSLQDRISFDRYDKEISDFISDVVLPSMFAEMKGTDKIMLNTVASETKGITQEKTIDQTHNTVASETKEIAQINGFDEEIVKLMRTDFSLLYKVDKKYKNQELTEAKLKEHMRVLTESYRKAGYSREFIKETLQKEIQEYEKKMETPSYANEEYKESIKKAEEIFKQKLKTGDKEVQKEAKQEYDEKVKEAQRIRNQRLGGKYVPSKEEIQEEETKKTLEAEQRENEIALSAPNSFVMSNSVSDLILQIITKEDKKHAQYKTDKERFDNLKDREQIINYISSITTNVASFPNENNDTAVFYCKRAAGNELGLLLFLDGNCIGIGTKNKGLLTKIPSSQFTGIRTLSLWNKDKELLSVPVDFSFKTYYPFKWDRNNITLADKVSDKAAVVSSSNSYEMSNSVSDLIVQTISQETKKHEQYKTDEEKFNQLKGKKQIIDYITTVTNTVTGSPQEDNETVVFFCEGAKGNDVVLLLFMDGRCIGIGTKNKGLLTQIPKTTGIHTLSLWSNDKEVLKMPVNFSFKTYYPFEWERNVIKLKN